MAKQKAFKGRQTRAGQLSILPGSQSDGQRVITVYLTDEVSGVRLFEVTIASEDFGRMLGSEAECRYWLGNAELAGMEYQHKEEQVFVPRRYDDPAEFDKLLDQAFAPYEVDGWRGRRSDATNGHNRVSNVTDFTLAQLAFKAGLERFTEDVSDIGGSVQRVHFSRHVDPATGVPVTK